MLCAAPSVLIPLANAPDEMKAGVPEGVRVLTAGAPPAAVTIGRLEAGLGWTVTHVYGLTETAPFITVCEPRPEHERLPPAERATIKARQGVELITSGELRVVTVDFDPQRSLTNWWNNRPATPVVQFDHSPGDLNRVYLEKRSFSSSGSR